MILTKYNFYKIGKNLFKIGVFFLPSALVISSVFLLLSLIISFAIKPSEILKDKWNYPFAISAVLLILSSSIHIFNYKGFSKIVEVPYPIVSWEPYFSFIGLANWIVLFLCFFGFKKYLSSPRDREICAKVIISGSMPVLITGFGQYFFNWIGPFSIFNDLIIWFQREVDEVHGLTGLFNNQNYAGCWLNVVLPFSIALFLDKSNNLLKKGVGVFFAIAISFAIYLTSSRSAWGGLIFSISLLIGPYIFSSLILLIIAFVIFSFFSLIGILPENLNNIFSSIPNILNTFMGFSPELDQGIPDIGKRLYIFNFGLQMIKEKLLFGWGSSSFGLHYFIANNLYISHPHNLILEMSFSYGVLPTIFIFPPILLIVFNILKNNFLCKPFKKESIFEKAWWISFVVLFCSQMLDVQYFDARISIIFWILLAGLREMLKTKDKIYNVI